GDSDYRDAVAALLTELIAAKAVVIEDYALPLCSGCDRTLHHVRVSGECPGCGTGACGGTCEGCGRFLTAATLQGAVSACCQAPPRLTLTQLPVLKLEEHREQLLEVWSQANIPPRVRQLIAGYLADGLPDIPMAYPSDWGIEWRHGDAQLRIDVWAEMAIGYLFSVARHVEAGRREHSGADVAGFAPSLADCLERWEPVDRVWHFLGIDNAFYYSTMIPALLTAAGVRTDFLGGLLVNEFLHLDGLKFSTSRNHAIWAHEFLADTDPGPLRAYLSWCRPDCHETDFTNADHAAFTSWYDAVTGAQPASGIPERLADMELERAVRALRLESFDPALAVRCVLGSYPARPAEAAEVLRRITGERNAGA
ncbi:MAG: class I tRNA ligase family protein, partial [Micromonosporaceae bacterium]